MTFILAFLGSHDYSIQLRRLSCTFPLLVVIHNNLEQRFRLRSTQPVSPKTLCPPRCQAAKRTASSTHQGPPHRVPRPRACLLSAPPVIPTITVVNWRENPVVPPLLLISTLASVCSFTGLIFSVYGALAVLQASVQVPGIEQRTK